MHFTGSAKFVFGGFAIFILRDPPNFILADPLNRRHNRFSHTPYRILLFTPFFCTSDQSQKNPSIISTSEVRQEW